MITPPKHPYNLNLNCFSSSSTSVTLSPSLRSSMTAIADRQGETILCTRPSSLPAYGGQPCDFLSNLDVLSTRTHPLPKGLSSQSKSHADICSARPVPPRNFSFGCHASPVQHDPVVEPYPDRPYISTQSSNTVAIEPYAPIPVTSSSTIGTHDQSFTEQNVLPGIKISESVPVPVTQVSTDPCVTASYIYTNRMCPTATDNKTCSITVHFPALCAHPNVGFFLDLASNVHLPALENDECWDNHLRLVNVLITLTDQTGRILYHTCQSVANTLRRHWLSSPFSYTVLIRRHKRRARAHKTREMRLLRRVTGGIRWTPLHISSVQLQHNTRTTFQGRRWSKRET